MSSDCYKSVFQIVLNKNDAHQLPEVETLLKAAGVEVLSVDAENGVIEGTAESVLVEELEKVHLFEYIRTSFKYWCHQPLASEESIND